MAKKMKLSNTSMLVGALIIAIVVGVVLNYRMDGFQGGAGSRPPAAVAAVAAAVGSRPPMAAAAAAGSRPPMAAAAGSRPPAPAAAGSRP